MDETLLHTAVLSKNLLLSAPFTGSLDGRAPVLFSGIALSVEDDNIFATKVPSPSPLPTHHCSVSNLPPPL